MPDIKDQPDLDALDRPLRADTVDGVVVASSPSNPHVVRAIAARDRPWSR
ncbi:hypothetical protein [Kibdelosporangium aridum]